MWKLTLFSLGVTLHHRIKQRKHNWKNDNPQASGCTFLRFTFYRNQYFIVHWFSLTLRHLESEADTQKRVQHLRPIDRFFLQTLSYLNSLFIYICFVLVVYFFFLFFMKKIRKKFQFRMMLYYSLFVRVRTIHIYICIYKHIMWLLYIILLHIDHIHCGIYNNNSVNLSNSE